ncbi:MAG: efflux transporter outer membrane subunit [Verrucomicrobiales bacterium]|nr:efflux transporter outer membrane subunit [Verrucomicrobiales bacterium]
MNHLSFVFTTTTIALLLGGCTVGPDYGKPDMSCFTPATWRANTGQQVEQPADLAVWWKKLNDPTLNSLITRSVECNLDVKSAEARIRQAVAIRRATKGDMFPSLSMDTSATRSQSPRNGTTSFLPRINETYKGGFDTSWEIDLFGGIRRSVEAADADQEAAVEDMRDVLVSLVSEVTLNYIDLRSFEQRISIAEKNLESQLSTLDFVRSRQQAGLIADLEVERFVENVENTRAGIPSLKTSYVAAKNRLTTLLGLTPGKLDELLQRRGILPHVPTRIAVGIPAEAIRRRPDVQSAERTLAAETARIGVAVADLYPKFALNGSIGLESINFSDFFDAGSRIFSIGPSASWDIFKGGTIRANIEAQDAVQEQALLAYEKTILTALEEVENALTALANEQIRERALARSAAATVKAAGIARSQYEDGGLTTFLDVLDAERSRLNAEDALATSRALIVTNLVQLYRALGGGWESVAPRCDDQNHSD